MAVEAKECRSCHRVFQTTNDYLTGTSRWRVCSKENLWFNCSCGSTLLIKKGKYDWYSPSASMRPEAQSVFNQLGSFKALPHIPAIALEIQQSLADPNTDGKTVAGMLRQEPVISAQVLNIAENLRRSRNPATPQIISLEHAAIYIGFKALSELVVTSSLRTFQLPQSDFNADEFWHESFLVAAVAEYVARHYVKTVNADDVYLSGALCNIGKLVLAFCFPPLVGKIHHDVSGKSIPLLTWRQAEKSYAFPDHCILGEVAAAIWGFPPQISDSIRLHHAEIDMKELKITIPEIVAFANQMTHWALSRPHRLEYSIIEQFTAKTKISDEVLDGLAKDLVTLRDNMVSSR